jgi:hypothetical protein
VVGFRFVIYVFHFERLSWLWGPSGKEWIALDCLSGDIQHCFTIYFFVVRGDVSFGTAYILVCSERAVGVLLGQSLVSPWPAIAERHGDFKELAFCLPMLGVAYTADVLWPGRTRSKLHTVQSSSSILSHVLSWPLSQHGSSGSVRSISSSWQ